MKNSLPSNASGIHQRTNLKVTWTNYVVQTAQLFILLNNAVNGRYYEHAFCNNITVSFSGETKNAHILRSQKMLKQRIVGKNVERFAKKVRIKVNDYYWKNINNYLGLEFLWHSIFCILFQEKTSVSEYRKVWRHEKFIL